MDRLRQYSEVRAAQLRGFMLHCALLERRPTCPTLVTLGPVFEAKAGGLVFRCLRESLPATLTKPALPRLSASPLLPSLPRGLFVTCTRSPRGQRCRKAAPTSPPPRARPPRPPVGLFRPRRRRLRSAPLGSARPRPSAAHLGGCEKARERKGREAGLELPVGRGGAPPGLASPEPALSRRPSGGRAHW